MSLWQTQVSKSMIMIWTSYHATCEEVVAEVEKEEVVAEVGDCRQYTSATTSSYHATCDEVATVKYLNLATGNCANPLLFHFGGHVALLCHIVQKRKLINHSDMLYYILTTTGLTLHALLPHSLTASLINCSDSNTWPHLNWQLWKAMHVHDCSDGSAPEETVVDMNEILENILYQQKETNKVSLNI